MVRNVKLEIELYEPMRKWLHEYLQEKYKGAEVITIDSHARTLDSYLEEYGIIDKYPQIVGLDIQIDVLGIVKSKRQTDIVFIEAKKTQLNLHDLGQLWAYCKLCSPSEAFLLSSMGLGSLSKIFNNLQRIDLLNYGDGKLIRAMRVAKWDLNRCSIDPLTMVPKL